MQKRTYQQLQPEERVTIASMKQQGSSVRAMARTLGRSASTVSRELTRNTCSAVGYASAPAQALSTNRREAARPCPKLHPQSVSWRIVLTLLEWKSLFQIRYEPERGSKTDVRIDRLWSDEVYRLMGRAAVFLIGASRAAARQAEGEDRGEPVGNGGTADQREAAVHSLALWAALLSTGGRGMIAGHDVAPLTCAAGAHAFEQFSACLVEFLRGLQIGQRARELAQLIERDAFAQEGVRFGQTGELVQRRHDVLCAVDALDATRLGLIRYGSGEQA